MNKLILIFSVLLLPILGNSQNMRRDYKFGQNISVFGPTYLSYSIDYFATPNINLEVGVGTKGSHSRSRGVTTGGIFGGLKYHFFGNKEWKATPYIGFYASKLLKDDIESAHKTYLLLYAPIGVQYINSKTFTFSFEYGLSYIPYSSNRNHYMIDLFKAGESEYFPNFSFKVGRRFGNKTQREERKKEYKPIRV